MSLQLDYGGASPHTPSTIPIVPNPSIYHHLNEPNSAVAANTSPFLPSAQALEHSWRDWVEEVVNDNGYTAGSVDTVATDANGANISLAKEEMKDVPTKATIGILATLISYLSINSYLKTTHPDLFVWRPEDLEDNEWRRTSKHWVDKKACRWLGVCGGSHIHTAGKWFGHKSIRPEQHVAASSETAQWESAWDEGQLRPEGLEHDEKVLGQIPDYVMEYAPLVHLFSGEQFWPCDIADHLHHVTPTLNYTPIAPKWRHTKLKALDKLNRWPPRWMFLTSNDDVEERPEWLEGEKNIPLDPSSDDDTFEGNDGWIHHPGRGFLDGVKMGYDDLKEWFAPGIEDAEKGSDFRRSLSGKSWLPKKNGSFRERYHGELKRRSEDASPVERMRGGRSDAPAVLVSIDKGHGIVDAFWFFFYSFNLGNTVFNVRFGNHIGDWEHTMIRFHNGEPKAVFFSEHNFGSAYSYEAVEKIGKRPVIYSATGTHAMYATPGLHPYVLPYGILHDETDRGPLWDPALNSHMYTYSLHNETLRSSNLTPHAPTGWFHFMGKWGDKFYPLNDRRQYRFLGQYHYVNGPIGPKFKHLGRKKVCQGPDEEACIIKHWLGGTNNIHVGKDFDQDEKDGMEG